MQLQTNFKAQLPPDAVMGFNKGNYVFFRGQISGKYPKNNGYYGRITYFQPGMGYNQVAKYSVDVFQDGLYRTSITCEWRDLMDTEGN
jgi:hypothetical protein